MNDKNKLNDPIPDEFSGYEEAAEFWDNHDTTDYLTDFVTVEAETNFRARFYEIEIEDEVARILEKRAKDLGVSMRRLASDLLRERLSTAA